MIHRKKKTYFQFTKKKKYDDAAPNSEKLQYAVEYSNLFTELYL